MKKLLLFCCCFLFSSPAFANWPTAVYFQRSFMGFYLVIIGLFIETTGLYLFKKNDFSKSLFIKWKMESTYAKIFYFVFLANLISFILGIFIIGFGGLPLALLLDVILPGGTFHPIKWIPTLLFIALINTLIELLIIYYSSRKQIKYSKKNFYILFVINIISSGLIIFNPILLF
jgi:hypothetical protein